MRLTGTLVMANQNEDKDWGWKERTEDFCKCGAPKQRHAKKCWLCTETDRQGRIKIIEGKGHD